MEVQMPDVPGWSFTVEEVSAGVYRVRGVDRSGRSVEKTGTEPEEILAELQEAAARMMASPGPRGPGGGQP